MLWWWEFDYKNIFFEEQELAVIFLGHTKNDQAETVLLGLARGSGTRSLSGMARSQERFVRPLLDISRSETEAACDELGVKYWQDPHNEDRTYLRVRARKLMPILEEEIGPGITDALARSAKLLRDDADAPSRATPPGQKPPTEGCPQLY